MTHQTITRKGTFDSGHRVMNECMKCFNLHGHTYHYELVFKFTQMEDIGYAIDFKEIKRVGCQWIDECFDHGTIINPHDTVLIQACKDLGSKYWLMSLKGTNEYCNPSAENIAKELFLGVSYLLNSDNLKLKQIRLYETPNCYTDCFSNSITEQEQNNFNRYNNASLSTFKELKGIVEYDDRNS
jgi:6-pyruvoyltetrahydropterin/6-carboxytetrahydropterin synthase